MKIRNACSTICHGICRAVMVPVRTVTFVARLINMKVSSLANRIFDKLCPSRVAARSLQGRVTTMQKDLERSKAKVSELTTKVSQLTAREGGLIQGILLQKKALSDKDKEIRALRENEEKLLKSNVDYEDSIDEKDETIAALQARIAELEPAAEPAVAEESREAEASFVGVPPSPVSEDDQTEVKLPIEPPTIVACAGQTEEGERPDFSVDAAPKSPRRHSGEVGRRELASIGIGQHTQRHYGSVGTRELNSLGIL